jgi:protein CSF1
MRAFEVQKATASLKRSSSFLDNRTLLIEVKDIGIAFPLALKNEIEVDAIGSVPAFLMSVKTAAFSAKRYESRHASLGRLSFQFVKQYVVVLRHLRFGY